MIEITDKNFEELVEKSIQVSMIDFGAEWCGPCRMIGPIIEEIAKEFSDVAVIGKVDVDSNPNITSKFGIRNIPAILFIKNGVVVDKQIGVATKKVLVDKLKSLL